MNYRRTDHLARVSFCLVMGSAASLLTCSSEDTTSSTGTGATSGNTVGVGSATGGAATMSAGTMASTGGVGGMSSSSTASGGSGATMTDYDCSAPSGAAPSLTLTLISDQLHQPVLVKSAPDNADRLYVVQKSGEIMIIENGAVLSTPFLDISSKVIDAGEEGLLGLAFHPDYGQNGRFFVHYSKASNGDNVIEEYQRSADPHVANAAPVQLVLEHPTAESNHNGGAVEFGPDGFLYVTMGDGGNQNDPECDAQLSSGGEAPAGTENLFGKVSRLDVNGACDAGGCPAASGNPNGGKAYHIGFRNPWRISFDACTGDLFVGDVGQNTYEEVDLIPQAAGALNNGWPYREGAHDFSTPSSCPPQPASVNEPILDYSHGSGRCAVAGGFVYRAAAMPGLRGAYFYGDYCTGEIWYKQSGSAEVLTSLSVDSLCAFGQDGHGNVYACGLGGTVYRIDPQQ